MSQDGSNSGERLESLLAEYLRSVEAGQPIDREALVTAHPQLAGELRAFFANRDAFERLAGPLRHAASPADTPTVGMPAADTPDADRIRYFGDYELLEEIARGGMGVVYRARQTSLQRIVAVKMILAGRLASDGDVRRFRQEAEAAARLDHPNIVPVYEVGEHRGQHYFSMGYVEGCSLAASMTRGPWTPTDAAELVRVVARAVQSAHDRGVIHRDLKPSNVLLDMDGRPRVTDFGLAKLTSREQSLTETGQALGTPGYMPPEQVEGGEVGPTADVYGLGAILYALLAGRPPFQAATVLETMRQVVSADPASPRQLNPSVPKDLDTLVMKCLEKLPRDRYATAGELADELQRFLNGEPIRARPLGVMERSARWLRRQRRSVVVAATSAVLGVLVIVGTSLGIAAYRRSLEGDLALDTPHPRLEARLQSAATTAVPEFWSSASEAPSPDWLSVPTPTPVTISEGDYLLHVSGPARFSEEFLTRVFKGSETQHTLNLEEQQLWTAPVTHGIARLVRLQGPGRPAWVVSLDDNAIRWRDPTSIGMIVPALTREKVPELPHARSHAFWAPWPLDGYFGAVGENDYQPYVLTDAPRLKPGIAPSDPFWLRDLVIGLRHSPTVFAVSANDFKVLWVRHAAGRSPQGDITQAFHGTLVGPPQVVSDIDGDGVVELLATFAYLDGEWKDFPPLNGSHARRVELLSGATGRPIWEFEIPPESFDRWGHGRWPMSKRWFPRGSGTMGGHGFLAPRRNFDVSARSGEHVKLPDPPVVCRVNGRETVTIVAGSRIEALEMSTGRPITPPADFDFAPLAPPRIADLDGDGDAEAVLLERDGSSTFERQGSQPRQRVHVWSLRDRRMVWTSEWLNGDWEKFFGPSHSEPAWPLIVDLDGDGHCELLMANDSSTPDTNETRWDRPWGSLALLEGVTGKRLWQRRIPTITQQIDRFLVGPDLDADGRREVFVVTLHQDLQQRVNPPVIDVVAEALSGSDGATLWMSRVPAERLSQPSDVAIVDRIQWWNVGADGWPELLVPLRDESFGHPLQLLSFSAGTGRLLRESHRLRPRSRTNPSQQNPQFAGASALPTPRILDVDGDGLDDLIGEHLSRNGIEPAGEIVALQGTSPQPWRRLGNDWQAASDYDGDGWNDVVNRKISFSGVHRSIVALSGRTGLELSRHPVNPNTWAGAQVRPLNADLDGDGLHDLLTVDSARGSGGETPFLHAYSGRTGKTLWAQSLEAGSTGRVYLLEPRDLDADGKPEIALVAEMSFAENGKRPSWTELPVWLVVLDGRSGRTKWKRALSRKQFTGSAWEAADVSPMTIAFADLNRDGIADLVVPTWSSESTADGWPIDLEFLSGATGDPLMPKYRTADRRSQEQLLSGLRMPSVVGEDLDGDGRPEIYCLELFEEPVADPAVPRTKFRLSRIDFGNATPRWSVDFRSPMPDENDSSLRHRPRPVVVHRKGGKHAIAVWSWGLYQIPGEVRLFDAEGKELWKSSVYSTDAGYSLRVVAHDLTGDGADELIFVNSETVERFSSGGIVARGVAVEAHDIAQRRLLWRTPLPTGLHQGRAWLFGVRPAADGLPATVEVLADRSLIGLSGTDGRRLWECAGLPEPYQGSLSALELLRHGDSLRPPRILWRTADDILCRQATPTDGSPFLGERVDPRLERGPDPRFLHLLPWQQDFGWPYDSPFWLALGLVFAAAWFVAPTIALWRLAARRDLTSLKMCLAVGVIAGLAFLLPTPDDAPMNRLRARWITAWMLLPIAVAVLLLVNAAAARRFRLIGRAAMGGAVLSLALGIGFIAIQWKLTPADEHWIWDAQFAWPFLFGAYIAAIIECAGFAAWHVLRRLSALRAKIARPA